MRRGLRVALGSLVIVLAAACDGGGGAGGGGAGAGGNTGGSGGDNTGGNTGGSGGAPVANPRWKAACKQYVGCLEKVDIGAAVDALDKYGDSGTCWGKSDSDQETCAKFCIQALATQHAKHATELACALCSEDAGCPFEPIPLCWQAGQLDAICGECAGFADCKNPAAPVCVGGFCKESGVGGSGAGGSGAGGSGGSGGGDRCLTCAEYLDEDGALCQGESEDLYLTLLDCVCYGGPCESACASTTCQGLAPNAACQSCVLNTSTGCGKEYQACANDI